MCLRIFHGLTGSVFSGFPFRPLKASVLVLAQLTVFLQKTLSRTEGGVCGLSAACYHLDLQRTDIRGERKREKWTLERNQTRAPISPSAETSAPVSTRLSKDVRLYVWWHFLMERSKISSKLIGSQLPSSDVNFLVSLRVRLVTACSYEHKRSQELIFPPNESYLCSIVCVWRWRSNGNVWNADFDCDKCRGLIVLAYLLFFFFFPIGWKLSLSWVPGLCICIWWIIWRNFSTFARIVSTCLITASLLGFFCRRMKNIILTSPASLKLEHWKWLLWGMTSRVAV